MAGQQGSGMGGGGRTRVELSFPDCHQASRHHRTVPSKPQVCTLWGNQCPVDGEGGKNIRTMSETGSIFCQGVWWGLGGHAFAQAAVTKCHRWGLKQHTLTSQRSGGCQSRIEELADLVSGDTSLPGL